MENINQLISLIISNENTVENMRELEIQIKEDQTQYIKEFVLQKGIIEFCIKQFNRYQLIEREKINGMCSLLISILVDNESAKQKMIDKGMGNLLCEMISSIQYDIISIVIYIQYYSPI